MGLALTGHFEKDNLVLALIMASMGLLDDISGKRSQPVAAGQPYFISDGKIIMMLILIFIIWAEV